MDIGLDSGFISVAEIFEHRLDNASEFQFDFEAILIPRMVPNWSQQECPVNSGSAVFSFKNGLQKWHRFLIVVCNRCLLVFCKDRKYYICDLNSTNGTLLRLSGESKNSDGFRLLEKQELCQNQYMILGGSTQKHGAK